jgi:hypothetical protein
LSPLGNKRSNKFICFRRYKWKFKFIKYRLSPKNIQRLYLQNTSLGAQFKPL